MAKTTFDLVAPSVTPGVYLCVDAPPSQHRGDQGVELLPASLGCYLFPGSQGTVSGDQIAQGSGIGGVHGHLAMVSIIGVASYGMAPVREELSAQGGVSRPELCVLRQMRWSGTVATASLTSAGAVWFAARLQRHKIRSAGSESPPAGTAVTRSSTRAVVTFR